MDTFYNWECVCSEYLDLILVYIFFIPSTCYFNRGAQTFYMHCKYIPRHFYQAAGAEWHVGAVSTERWVAGHIPSVDHPELSNQLPAALPCSIHMEHT